MQWLKQSTAVSKIVGPILDSAGAEYASAVIGDLSLSKNGGTLTALASAATLTYIANGYYTLALTTGNTDTLGSAEISCNKSTYQMPPREFMVLPATVYDALVTNATTAAGGLGDIQRMAGTALTARDIGASVLLSSGTGTGQVKLSGGYVAPNWGDVGNPTTAVSLSGTTVKTATDVEADTDALLLRLTSARAGYLDNLNVGGAVASQADVNALNQSASRRILLTTVGQYERPESGSTVYTVEARTFDGDGAAADADSTPTLTATGQTSGSLAANLSAATNPATGVYRWTYTVSSAATQEPIRFDVSATMTTAFTLACYTQVVDLVAATWTATDRTMLTQVYNRVDATIASRMATFTLPANFESLAIGLDGVVQANLVQFLATSYGEAIAGTVAANFAQLFNNSGSPPQNIIAGAVDADITAGHGSGSYVAPTAAGIRSAVGLAAANLDTQLAALAAYVDTEVAAILAAVDTEVAAIKAKTDALPADPAAVGSAMTLTGGERDSIAAALLDLANGIESGLTPRQALRLFAAALAGNVSDDGTTYNAAASGTTARLTVAASGSAGRTVTRTP